MSSKIHHKLYKKAIQRYGVQDVRSLLWNSTKSQHSRFEVLIKYEDFTNNSVLDLGCGRGDFYSFLMMKKKQILSYTGVDFTEEFIEYAQKQYPNKKFIYGDFFNVKVSLTDIVLCNGALNMKVEDNLLFLQRFIDHFLPYTKKKFMITLLKYAPGYISNPYIHTYDIDKVKKMLDSINLKYTIDSEYTDNDFLVVLYKGVA